MFQRLSCTHDESSCSAKEYFSDGGEVWRRCFPSLAVNTTPIRNEAAKLFTSSYDNFIQTAGIRDGVSPCVKQQGF